MTLLAAAVENNARWCDAVCNALGCDTTRMDGLWVNRSPGPPYYSNAVTLDPVDTATQSARVRSMLDWGLPRPWSIKDSFRRLALAPLGFGILFEAQWIGRPADHRSRKPVDGDIAWGPVTRDPDLVAWEAAWRGANTAAADAGVARLFQPVLLDDPDIRFLAGMREGRIVAVAVANRSDDGSGPVVGISNIVLTDGDLRTDGAGVIAAVQDAFPDLPMVGYERGDDLTTMMALGFRSMGPLRVWVTAP
jgi:hypothetical protein